MIDITKSNTYGWEEAIRGMRNPMNSWDKIDSYYDETNRYFTVGPNDYALMKKLAEAGSDHRKYLRQIAVYVDVEAPIFWWKEYDTYKVGTVANSCSTMHKIHARPLTIDDFTAENLESDAKEIMLSTINVLNSLREKFNETKEKKYWRQMIELLPSSYNQKRTLSLNYEVLRNIYRARKNHKLTEWHTFCDWIRSLPYSELITGEYDEATS